MEYRFIPTPVGNSPCGVSNTIIESVHPHACGELCRRFQKIITDLGSSPRLWGTHYMGRKSKRFIRFIPTPVGNSKSVKYPACVLTVHPHACGELFYDIPQIFLHFGSSPRLWGTRGYRYHRMSHRRFIPTPVGNSPDEIQISINLSVHPHACGELKPLPKRKSHNPGSSPRLWGTRI